MIQLGQLIDFIRGEAITTPIYRTIAPLDVAFPAITTSINNTTVSSGLEGDIQVESLQISINIFHSSPAGVDTLSDTITDRLLSLKGTTAPYTITGFYLTSRKTIDYTDETTGKLVYGNSYDFKLTVQK